MVVNKNRVRALWQKALGIVECKYDIEYDANSYQDLILKYIYKYICYFFKAIVNDGNHYTDNMKLHLLANHLLQELHNFERRFCKYLKNNIENPNNKELNTDYIINSVNLLAQITGFSSPDYEDMDDLIDFDEGTVWEEISPKQRVGKVIRIKTVSEELKNLRYTNILSFNYTALFDILGVNSPCKYRNVHGKLCNSNCSAECNSSSVIFGIDDTIIQAQDSNSELRLFSKTYRKMLCEGSPASILPSNNKPLEIKFYGHSLGEADYSYFQSIFDYYNLYGNNDVSLIFYYSKGFEQNDAIYQLINSYGKTLANKDQGKNLIHKLLLENRLKIIELKEIN